MSDLVLVSVNTPLRITLNGAFMVTDSETDRVTIVLFICTCFCLQGSWVFLLNGHNNVNLISSLEHMVKENESIDPSFRAVITSECDTNIPVSMLHSGIKVIVDSPRVSTLVSNGTVI